MMKRNGEHDQKNSKKIKLDDEIEALWDDDFDADALDECINLATQVYEQEKITCSQLNNVTLLPNYNAFKSKTSMLSSTQLTQFNNNIAKPSTSKYEFIPKKIEPKDLEKQLNTLQEQYKEKEGEVSILRTQLRETKSNIQTEQQKFLNEWKQKLTQTEKQMKSAKSDLEFKDLEIANLKQKILEISKLNISDRTLYASQNITSNTKVEKVIEDAVNVQPKILQPFLEPKYPLKDTLEDIVNIPKRERHFTETKLIQTCRNTIPYLQNQLISNMVVDKSDFSINLVHSDLLQLVHCTEEELNHKEKLRHLNKIVCACEQFVYDLQRFLENIKGNLRTEDILEADSSFLKYQGGFTDWKNQISQTDEMGVKSSILINFLGQVLPYNDYLQTYVCRNKPLIFIEKETFRKQFPYYVFKEQIPTSHYFLHSILNIVRIAGEIRKSNYMSKFLIATIKLLININKSRNYDYVSDIFCELTKQIILSRPPIEVTCEITFLFKPASQHSSFVEFLLNKSDNLATSRKGILYFNEDACRFYVFVMLFDNGIFELKNEIFSLNICLNLLCFIYNTFKTCYWIHHRDVKKCECVPQLYKLGIEIISKALEKYLQESKEKLISSEWAYIFKTPITSKILNLMAFNSYELTQKYITVFSQFKEIEKRLQEEDNLIDLKLNIADEPLEISSDVFKKLVF